MNLPIIIASLLFCNTIAIYYGLPRTVFTIHQVKELYRNSSIEAGDIYIMPGRENGICNCSQELLPLSSFEDTLNVSTDLVLGYPKSVITRCTNTLVYPVYRVLLNQTYINYGVCKNGLYSRDLQDVEFMFPSPRDPLPPLPSPDPKVPKEPKEPEDPKKPKQPKVPLPKPKEPEVPEDPKSPSPHPSECPPKCVDLIKMIPKGEKGERGPIGPPGEGRGGSINGIAPSRNKYIAHRTYFDVMQAFNKYTGCSIKKDEGVQWHVNDKRPTDCKLRNEPFTKLMNKDVTEAVQYGYVIIWFWNNHEDWYTTAMAYRTDENDIVPVLCGHNPSPVFLNRMQQRSEDILCSVSKHQSQVFYYTVIFASVLIPCAIVLLNLEYVRLTCRNLKYLHQFAQSIISNRILADEQEDPLILEEVNN